MRVDEPPRDGGIATVCFVCTGNVCRSAAAEVVFEHLLTAAGLSEAVAVTSAGTSRWNRDAQMDPRAQEWLEVHGYEVGEHHARLFDPSWLGRVDLAVAMDRTHRRSLRGLAPGEPERRRIALLCSFDPELSPLQDIPDPYPFDDDAFGRVMETIEQACRWLLLHVSEGNLSTAPR